jgi:glycosyltransferase involved in cell wall biosynthesis
VEPRILKEEPGVLPDESLRVGYVVKRYPRYSETFIVSEILAHEAQGLPVTIFSLRPPNDTHFQDVLARVRAPVIYLPSEGLKAAELWQAISAAGAELPGLWPALAQARGLDAQDVYQAVLLARAAGRHGIGHLHAHFASLATSVARLAARIGGLTYSFTAHAKDVFHESVQADDLRRKLQDAAAVITVSDYNRVYLQQTYDAAAGTVHRVYNGLNLDLFPYAPPWERPPVIAAVGRLVEKKGFEDLIDACALLAQEGRGFACRIVGAGELAAALQARITRLGLDERVRLVGPRPQHEVFGYLVV